MYIGPKIYVLNIYNGFKKIGIEYSCVLNNGIGMYTGWMVNIFNKKEILEDGINFAKSEIKFNPWAYYSNLIPRVNCEGY